MKQVAASNAPGFGETVRACRRYRQSRARDQWLLAQKGSDAALAGATPYLRLFGNAAGGCLLAEQALAELRRRRRRRAHRARALLRREHRGAGLWPRAQRHRRRRQHPRRASRARGVSHCCKRCIKFGVMPGLDPGIRGELARSASRKFVLVEAPHGLPGQARQ